MWMTDLPSKSLNFVKKVLTVQISRDLVLDCSGQMSKNNMLLRNNCRVKIITSQHVHCATQLKTEIHYKKYICFGNITYH